MPSVPRNLKNRARAQAQIELILLLSQAGRAGLALKGLLNNESFEQYAGYDGEPHKEIDRLIEGLMTAGYEIERFEWEGLYGEQEWSLRLVEQPFVPIPVTESELPEILRLVSTYLASKAAYRGGIPTDVLLAKRARATSHTLIAESPSKSFSMIPLGERLLTNGRWEIVGLLPNHATVITPRVGGRYSFSIGDEITHTPNIAIDVDDVGTPLSWGSGEPFRASFEVPDGAIGSVVANFGAAITSTTDIGSGWEAFEVSGTNRPELYRLLARLRGNVRNIRPPDIDHGFDVFLDELLAVEPLAEGFAEGPRILEPQKPVPTSVDLAADQPLLSERGHGGVSSVALVQRLVLVLRHLDMHGSASVDELSGLAGLPAPQAIQLVECFRAAYGRVFDDGGISLVSRGSDVVGVSETARTLLLKSTGRYYITQGQMLAAAAAALVELETTEPDPHREELLEAIVERAERTLGYDIDVPADGPGPSLELHEFLRKNIGKVISLTYTNPWEVTTTRREIVPLHEPRQLGGRWIVGAMDVEADPSGRRGSITPFYLDFMEDLAATGRAVPIPYSEQDIEASMRVSGRTQAVLRVKKGSQLDWITAVWGARSIQQCGHEAADEVSVAVEVYPPAAERLFDLFIQSGGDIRVDRPPELRRDALERIKRMRG